MSQRINEQLRQRLAQKTAKIILESGMRDFQAAKQKAAQQLGAVDTKNLPNNAEIELAISEYQRIFRASSQPQHLTRLREIAIEAMQFLERFNPRLVGSVLSGTADEHSAVRLHVFADTVESVGFYLTENKIPNELGERRLKTANDQYQKYSSYEFIVDNIQVELLVFLPKQSTSPLSPIDGKLMRRADITEVELLLNQEE